MIDMDRLFDEKPYSIMNTDCMEMLRDLPDDSLGLILTDPPYNLGLFMKDYFTNISN